MSTGSAPPTRIDGQRSSTEANLLALLGSGGRPHKATTHGMRIATSCAASASPW